MRETATSPRERGATFVEFALILPLLMAVILGLFTGGLAYNRKISLTHAAREASRYGATLPVSEFAAYADPMAAWLEQVAKITRQSASGELGAGTPGREICVAWVYPQDISGANQTKSYTYTSSDTAPGVPASTPCFDDSRPATERRVQVSVKRWSEFEAFFFSRTLTLASTSTTKFEATST